MGPLSIRAARPDNAETLFVIHRESAMTAHVEVFPPDLYRFPDEQMRKVWAEAQRGHVRADRRASRQSGRVRDRLAGLAAEPVRAAGRVGPAEPALRSTTRPLR